MWHAIAIKTILPSLKSARDYCGKIRTPVIIASGSPDVCYAALKNISTGRLMNELQGVLHGLPAFDTADYTYFIIGDENESARVRV